MGPTTKLNLPPELYSRPLHTRFYGSCALMQQVDSPLLRDGCFAGPLVVKC